jgi:type IV secretion system protein TrbL
MKESFASGARSSFADTGGSSTMGTVGGGEAASSASPAQTPSGPSDSGPPAWAQRMKRNQAMSQGTQTAAQALKSGDSHGGGHSVDLSGGE